MQDIIASGFKLEKPANFKDTLKNFRRERREERINNERLGKEIIRIIEIIPGLSIDSEVRTDKYLRKSINVQNSENGAVLVLGGNNNGLLEVKINEVKMKKAEDDELEILFKRTSGETDSPVELTLTFKTENLRLNSAKLAYRSTRTENSDLEKGEIRLDKDSNVLKNSGDDAEKLEILIEEGTHVNLIPWIQRITMPQNLKDDLDIKELIQAGV